MNHSSRTVVNRLLFGCVAAAALSLTACAHHHHHDDDDRIVIEDEHGWRHEGRYDADRRWHGGYYDDRHEYHEDRDDWHR